MTNYETVQSQLNKTCYTWLITGVAGFIGSNLLQALLRLNQKVVGVDNFSTGFVLNLDFVRSNVTDTQWKNFHFIEGDIRNLEICQQACTSVDYVLHQAALGSVPRSLENPAATHGSNVDGFLNMLIASRDAGVSRFIYASSSSVYGDSPVLPKMENLTGEPLSPYALSKVINEKYANVFSRCYGMECMGLRYFNIFGPYQNPNGAYAAVIPRWASAMIAGEPCYINGDGLTSRDFSFIENAIQANLLAALVQEAEALNQVYNVAVGEQTSLLQLFEYMKDILSVNYPHLRNFYPEFKPFREGDVAHSLASVQKSRNLLGYEPTHTIQEGLRATLDWYMDQSENQAIATRLQRVDIKS